VFASPLAVSALLGVNGCILLAGEAIRRRASARRIDTLRFGDAALIGIAQAPALLGGISRSGLTITAGLLRGLDHRDAARFSFLMATPVIFGAGLYELPDMLGGGGAAGPSLVGALCAAIAAYAAVRFMMHFLARTGLVPFGVYCIAIGAISVVRFL
jgi:undecaprenyl-diphosphatase